MRRPSIWLPIVLWCALIFALSHRSDIGPTGPVLTWPEYLLRKGAHVFEYAVLYGLVRRGWPSLPSWLFCVLYAASDEWHQSFVPGRMGRVSDVVLDSCAAGLAAWFTAFRRR